MSDYFNHYQLKQFARTVAECIGLELPEAYAPSVKWVSRLLTERMGGTADRAVLYHADAVGMYIWQKYTDLFAPVYANTSMAIPFESTVESVTPVAHASMYTGLDPAGHGIQTYVRPVLQCDTLYDQLIKAGKKVAIVAQTDSTFMHIFNDRAMDYYDEANATAIQERALELLAQDKYDVVSIHSCDYDTAAHHYGPESKEALNVLSLEAEGFDRIAKVMKTFEGRHRVLLSYSPDHGQHLTAGGTGSHGSKMLEDMNILHFFGTI